jgi:hypothetical protein
VKCHDNPQGECHRLGIPESSDHPGKGPIHYKGVDKLLGEEVPVFGNPRNEQKWAKARRGNRLGGGQRTGKKSRLMRKYLTHLGEFQVVPSVPNFQCETQHNKKQGWGCGKHPGQ